MPFDVKALINRFTPLGYEALAMRLEAHAAEMRDDGVALYCPDLLEQAALAIRYLKTPEPPKDAAPKQRTAPAEVQPG